MKGKHIIIGLIILAVVIGLLLLGRLSGTTVSSVWKDTKISCLVSGHQNLAFHFHPTLRIIVDGTAEPIPANIGISGTCMAEVHTHDASGTIHVESTEPAKQLTLGDFFIVWEKELFRNGHELTASSGGVVLTSPSDLVLKDGQRIELVYTTIKDSEAEVEADESSEQPAE